MQLGMRQARYLGPVKTLYQLLMAATVANLTLVATKAGLIRDKGRRHSHLFAQFLARTMAILALISVSADTLGLADSTLSQKTGFRLSF